MPGTPRRCRSPTSAVRASRGSRRRTRNPRRCRGGSKGSISTALKFLTTARWVDKASKPGDRKDYYTIRPGVMPDMIKQQAAQYSLFTEVTARGMALFDDPDAEPAKRLRDMHDFFQWLEKQLPALMERWDRERP